MLLYNISIIVEDEHHDDLLAWLKTAWLPVLPEEVKFLKMLNSPHEGTTYCMQIVVPNEHDVVLFQEKFLMSLNDRIGTHHYEKAFIFDSVMQYLN